ncbi:hypothetical protein IFM89_020741 [Coptis chinensis]|uniref:Uncharacterized protein n=1 Tax=Coptis chinensis TaxID=261450 RepID=A0A835IFI2_9MAGN|nr:hypothetical protein IFM89_020741 [Coptis chinensis]
MLLSCQSLTCFSYPDPPLLMAVRTALVALIAFMPTNPNGALGSLDYKKEERRCLAIKSRGAAPKFRTSERERLIDEPLLDESQTPKPKTGIDAREVHANAGPLSVGLITMNVSRRVPATEHGEQLQRPEIIRHVSHRLESLALRLTSHSSKYTPSQSYNGLQTEGPKSNDMLSMQPQISASPHEGVSLTKQSRRKHQEKVDCRSLMNTDIANAVELSIAASEALSISELVNSASASEVFPVSAVLEVALRVKQAWIQLCQQRLANISDCVTDVVDETVLLQDLDEDTMADACLQVGISWQFRVLRKCHDCFLHDNKFGDAALKRFGAVRVVYIRSHCLIGLVLDQLNGDERKEIPRLDNELWRFPQSIYSLPSQLDLSLNSGTMEDKGASLSPEELRPSRRAWRFFEVELH